MKNLLKLIIPLYFIYYLSVTSLFAATATGTAPTITITNLNGDTSSATLDPLNAALNGQIATQFTAGLNEANLELAKYHNQGDLAKGFANANAYAAQAATHQGFQDYTLFAITSGVMVGAQLPSSDPDYYNEIDKKVKKDGDLYAGVAASWAIINAGINAGFLYPGLYLSAKFGYLSRDITDELSATSTILGVGANYTWIQTKSLLAGFVKWRGVSFGTGFIYNRNKIDLNIEMDPERNAITGLNLSVYGLSNLTGDVVLDPSFTIGVKTNTYTIPFDVTTSVRLLWVLNFNLGAGFDFVFGTSDITLKSNGDVYADMNPVANVDFTSTKGKVTIDGSTKNKKPSPVRERITTGLGLNIAMVKIDFPIIIYPFDSAIAAGVTIGVVF
jgi:hypothetical protein